MFLADLPLDHVDRNHPVAGLFHRWHSWKGEDITVALCDRDETWRWWGASPWKLIPLKARNPMPISSMTYNELEAAGGFWTSTSDWATEKLPPRKPGELTPPE